MEVPKSWHKTIGWTILTLFCLELSSPPMGTLSGPETYDFWGRPQIGVTLKFWKLVSDIHPKLLQLGMWSDRGSHFPKQAAWFVVGIGSCCLMCHWKAKILVKLQLTILSKYLTNFSFFRWNGLKFGWTIVLNQNYSSDKPKLDAENLNTGWCDPRSRLSVDVLTSLLRKRPSLFLKLNCSVGTKS